jgi:hypothetical protein
MVITIAKNQQISHPVLTHLPTTQPEFLTPQRSSQPCYDTLLEAPFHPFPDKPQQRHNMRLPLFFSRLLFDQSFAPARASQWLQDTFVVLLTIHLNGIKKYPLNFSLLFLKQTD